MIWDVTMALAVTLMATASPEMASIAVFLMMVLGRSNRHQRQSTERREVMRDGRNPP
jgi:hypothetical protein